jgi:hypothetical protein
MKLIVDANCSDRVDPTVNTCFLVNGNYTFSFRIITIPSVGDRLLLRVLCSGSFSSNVEVCGIPRVSFKEPVKVSTKGAPTVM